MTSPPRSRRVRVAAYAVAVTGGSILLTKLSHIDADAGRWTLPGGGLGFGEDPEDALHREVYEETGLRGEIEAFLGTDSLTVEPDSGPQALHAIRLVYRVRLSGAPVVIEEDGTTELAAWVALEDVAELPTVALVDNALRLAGLVVGR